MIKKSFLFLGLLVIIVAVLNIELFLYGIRQGKGQLQIIWNAESIEKVLSDSTTSDSLRKQLMLVGEIRNFAIQDLGLAHSKNYTTLYDQNGKPLLWLVQASEPYRLKAYEWSFPIVGTVSYKGFFDLDLAIQLRDKLRQSGYDTYIREVSAWSTLGWFKDPILSEMLKDDPGDLANTIIHELTHATIFVKDSLTFNENLASFIGNKGAELFLSRDNVSSEELKQYRNLKADRELLTNHLLAGARYLDSLYGGFIGFDSLQMEKEKTLAIDRIVVTMDTLDFNNPLYRQIFSEFRPNNAYFMSYLLYRSRQNSLDSVFENQFNSDLKGFIQMFKSKYPSN